MKNKKIVIAGGTGFIGQYLSKKFKLVGYDVIIISRQKNCTNWDNYQEIIYSLENAEMVINLAGKSVDCRYNERNKAEILSSRTVTTEIIGNAIEKCNNPPKLWINSSTATIYRHSEDKPMTESNGEIGSGFSVDVATKWENAFFKFKLKNTRQIALRIAIVLGENGGAMKPLIKLVKFGLGGKQGNGKQMFSWLHIEDLFEIIQFLGSNENLNGVFNCSSPNPVTNEFLMKSIRKIMNTRIGIPSPKFLLEIGARIINTETELVLKSRWVIPERLLNAGFKFRYKTLEEALRNIITEQ